MVELNAIVAISKDRAIAVNGEIPWHLATDMRMFKTITMGHAVLMGRKTYESIGHPLPGRVNIVLTRKKCVSGDDVYYVNSMKEAMVIADHMGCDKLFIIGGAMLYMAYMKDCKKAYVTTVDVSYSNEKGDVLRLPDQIFSWLQTTSTLRFAADSENDYDFGHTVLIR